MSAAASDFDFDHYAASAPDETAIIEPGGRTCSRGQLAAMGNQLASALIDAGLTAGDRVVLIAPNCIEYLAVYRCVMRHGLYLVTINWHLAPHEIADILANCTAKALIVHERCGASILAELRARAACPPVLISIGTLSGCRRFSELIEQYSHSAPQRRAVGRLMPYTSATTGQAKGIRRALTSTRFNASTRKSVLPECGGSDASRNVHLCNSMLYHAPVLYVVAAELEAGHAVVLVDTWEPQLALQLIERHRVTTTFMVPTMFIRLLKLSEQVRRRYDVASLRWVLHSAAPCPVAVKRAMLEWWGPILWERYGSVEGPVTLVSPEEWLKYPGTVGRPESGIDVKILDAHGEPAPPGQPGTIYVRPRPGTEFEYLGDPDKTRAARRGDYYTAGDLGYLNGDGYLFLCDRDADLIVCGGINIYPAEIEQVLVQHPAVADCAVLGARHEIFGRVPRAVIQPEPGVAPGAQLTADIAIFLGERLAVIKLPKHFEYVEKLPRDPNGKLYKRVLHETRAGDVPTPKLTVVAQ
jgi:long-chain acyl-CoA synthetase